MIYPSPRRRLITSFRYISSVAQIAIAVRKKKLSVWRGYVAFTVDLGNAQIKDDGSHTVEGTKSGRRKRRRC